jgi:hypothetical protein
VLQVTQDSLPSAHHSWVRHGLTGGWVRCVDDEGRAIVKMAPLALRLGMRRLSDTWARMGTAIMERRVASAGDHLPPQAEAGAAAAATVAAEGVNPTASAGLGEAHEEVIPVD